MLENTGEFDHLYLNLSMCLISRLSKLLPDLEEEDAENDHADHDVERDAKFDDHRHPVRCAGGGKEQAIFHCQKSDHLRHRLAARNRRRKASSTASAMPMVERVMVPDICEIG